MNSHSSPATYLHQSNLLTYGSLMAGIAAVASAVHGNAAAAGALVAVAVLADTFDGRFARLFPRDDQQKAFGAHLDSLSDVASFGIAPPICLFALAARPAAPLEWAWWAAAFVYAACAITRLGFYDLTHTDSAGFVGLPVPVAALVLSSALLSGPSLVTSTALLLGTSVAMIAPWRIPRPAGAGLALFVLWPVALVIANIVWR